MCSDFVREMPNSVLPTAVTASEAQCFQHDSESKRQKLQVKTLAISAAKEIVRYFIRYLGIHLTRSNNQPGLLCRNVDGLHEDAFRKRLDLWPQNRLFDHEGASAYRMLSVKIFTENKKSLQDRTFRLICQIRL
jgi:hypothetical protein